MSDTYAFQIWYIELTQLNYGKGNDVSINLKTS